MKLSRNLLAMVLLSFTVLGATPVFAQLNDDLIEQAILSGGEPLQQAFEAADRGEWHKAAKLFPPLAEQGNVGAQFMLAAMFNEGMGVKQDFQQAAKWYAKAAEQGLAEAQFSLANAYHEGKGVKQDDFQAFKWTQKAA
ncbi:sel1 repeat family protein, partial [Avibacterium paragallinarum]